MAPSDQVAIVKAFFHVVQQKRRSFIMHGKWIPIMYWNHLVNKQLGFSVKASKLVKAIECYCGRSLEGNAEIVGSVMFVSITEARIKRRCKSIVVVDSTTKKHHFVCVETKDDAAEKLPTNNLAKGCFFQGMYNKLQKQGKS